MKYREIPIEKINIERFKKYISPFKTRKGCIEWIGGTTGRTGYGYFRVMHEKYLAHRIAFLLKFGEINNELAIMHKCDNRLCINPEHLSEGTQLENVKDAIAKNRMVHYKGEKNGAAKLKDKDIPIIRAKLSNGIFMREIASEFGVGKSTIFRIAHKTIWAHI